MPLHIKQYSKIAHAQAIRGLAFMQSFDVPMKSELQSFNLANYLCAFTRGQRVKIFQRRSAIFDLEAVAIHFRLFKIYAIKCRNSRLVGRKTKFFLTLFSPLFLLPMYMC